MKAYAYTAYTSAGRKRRGTVVAETEADAAAQLTAQDLFPADLSEARRRGPKRAGGETGAGRGAASRWRQRRLIPDLQAVFTRQMAVMLAAELPVDEALEAVRAGGHPALDAMAAQARAALLDGAALSEALADAGAGFPPFYLAALRAGEEAGELAAVFDGLAAHLEQQNTARAGIATALVYPGFVAAVSVLVCGILMTSVAPEIVAMFEMTGRPLPPLTEMVLAVSDFLRDQAAVLAVLAAALAVFLAAVPRVPRLRRLRDRILLRLPVLGRLARLGEAVQYMRTLALVLGSRHAVLSAASSAAGVLEIARFQDEAGAVAAAVRQGESLSAALGRLSFLPPVARQLISAGEVSVQLARMTGRAADLTEHRLQTERKRIAALLEPVLMMLVGGLVLVIVLAVLLPVFDLQAAVAG
ncbi:type II secretion system F family protein (plasmid) [Leisingera sp. M527]|uniref:type II secretion system F family protein n=1 Tax=Leisingera sp. M527 TaxID=2867014 RepID=UPI0021A57BA9|nr:type II secretion system F family protein [Leisingera sp. M527]UWQ35174.1 type II secretion system F family protein [Leisingera sp. M527]